MYRNHVSDISGTLNLQEFQKSNVLISYIFPSLIAFSYQIREYVSVLIESVGSRLWLTNLSLILDNDNTCFTHFSGKNVHSGGFQELILNCYEKSGSYLRSFHLH
jgi:hypothetical protein